MARYVPTPLKGFCIVNLDTMDWALEPATSVAWTFPDQQHSWHIEFEEE
jgi:hypothetical protein